jgi:hypothetical protein
MEPRVETVLAQMVEGGGRIAQQSLGHKHYRPDDRQLCSGSGKKEAFPDQPEMGRSPQSADACRARPSGSICSVSRGWHRQIPQGCSTME